MKTHAMKPISLIILIAAMICTTINTNAQTDELSYNQLQKDFKSPDYSYWGEVPLWWWEGESMDRERITWQLEELSAKCVKAVCPIQRSPPEVTLNHSADKSEPEEYTRTVKFDNGLMGGQEYKAGRYTFTTKSTMGSFKLTEPLSSGLLGPVTIEQTRIK